VSLEGRRPGRLGRILRGPLLRPPQDDGIERGDSMSGGGGAVAALRQINHTSAQSLWVR
jgi:hypothetical protein